MKDRNIWLSECQSTVDEDIDTPGELFTGAQEHGRISNEMKYHRRSYSALLGCVTCIAPSFYTSNGFPVARASCDRKRIQENPEKRPMRTVNSTAEDGLVVDATVTAILKFGELRARLPKESTASKIIVNVNEGNGNFFNTINKLVKQKQHPAAVFMDVQFRKHIPEDVLNDHDHRNADEISWSKYKSGNPAIVIEYDEEVVKRYAFDEPVDDWYQKNPDYVGHISPFLPGYSRRKSIAILRFSYGPVNHMCLGSCLLVKDNGKWTVKRIEMTDIL